jgi:hypothetical protein
VVGKKALFDSNIITYLSKRELPTSYIDQFDDHFISVITYMEILGHRFRESKEEKFVHELLSLRRSEGECPRERVCPVKYASNFNGFCAYLCVSVANSNNSSNYP